MDKVLAFMREFLGRLLLLSFVTLWFSSSYFEWADWLAWSTFLFVMLSFFGCTIPLIFDWIRHFRHYTKWAHLVVFASIIGVFLLSASLFYRDGVFDYGFFLSLGSAMAIVYFIMVSTLLSEVFRVVGPYNEIPVNGRYSRVFSDDNGEVGAKGSLSVVLLDDSEGTLSLPTADKRDG